MATKSKAIIQVINEELIGSLSLTLPLANHLITDCNGNERSADKACKVRGATITEPMADEIVDAANPRGMTTAPHIYSSPIDHLPDHQHWRFELVYLL